MRDGRGRTVCWWSAGAASAVATWLALRDAPDAVVCYQETGAEHPDNARFLADCERWYGVSIERVRSERYRDTWDVWQARRYIAGIRGAPCTSELKRIPAEKFLLDKVGLGAREVFGYTVEERQRVERWQANNPERNIWPILIERGLTKADCLGLLERVGIEIPAMYRMGFQNNNCIGCPKGQQAYWNRIRVHFPEAFDRMARLERELNCAVNKVYVNGVRQRVFLDELDPDAGRDEPEQPISCGLFCMDAADDQ